LVHTSKSEKIQRLDMIGGVRDQRQDLGLPGFAFAHELGVVVGSETSPFPNPLNVTTSDRQIMNVSDSGGSLTGTNTCRAISTSVDLSIDSRQFTNFRFSKIGISSSNPRTAMAGRCDLPIEDGQYTNSRIIDPG
jgi:hypothetical protein